MAKTEATREEVARQWVEVAFDEAYQIREEYTGETGLLARRKANREDLRSLATRGYLSDEQLAELEELYPARARSEQEEEESAAQNGGNQ